MAMVLVTGATGFVGRHITRMLLAYGWSVKAAVRSRDRLAHLDPAVQGYVVGPIDGTTDWGDILQRVDVVVHLAARVHVLRDTDANPLESYREVNVYGTRRLLEACVESGVRRFVFMSSVKAVGEATATEDPFTEVDSCNPEDAYGLSKLEAEQIVMDYGRSGKIEVTILRPPLVYGPGVKANFYRLMRAVDAGLPLPFKNVDNKRSMVYVKNLVDAVRVCCEHPGAVNQVFFVADDQPLATPELISEIAAAMGKRPRLIGVPVSMLQGVARLFGMTEEINRLIGSLVVSIEKIKRLLNWSPPWSVSEGIRNTVNWYQNTRTEHRNGR